ncbi:hypothetical protein D1970_04185 [Mesobacillus zeae]|uniref:Uncharacterized protein n=1 Tax=Mesobacillus zeae TaxID=1917180 RepID=A0A398BCW0_9BACI|nr:hypothetical protein D1970_04185 [Mesobacillus zeae]
MQHNCCSYHKYTLLRKNKTRKWACPAKQNAFHTVILCTEIKLSTSFVNMYAKNTGSTKSGKLSPEKIA